MKIKIYNDKWRGVFTKRIARHFQSFKYSRIFSKKFFEKSENGHFKNVQNRKTQKTLLKKFVKK